MDGDALTLDGNAVAGLLGAALGAEVTAAVRACGSCGERRALGAHRAYVAAGIVLRCPVCGDVALTVAGVAEARVVRVTGTWVAELPARAATMGGETR